MTAEYSALMVKLMPSPLKLKEHFGRGDKKKIRARREQKGLWHAFFWECISQCSHDISEGCGCLQWTCTGLDCEHWVLNQGVTYGGLLFFTELLVTDRFWGKGSHDLQLRNRGGGAHILAYPILCNCFCASFRLFLFYGSVLEIKVRCDVNWDITVVLRKVHC